jgi:phosphatidylglycerophosphate synthase
VIKEKLGHRVDRVVHVLFPFLFVRKVNPDLLTVLGAVVSLAAAAAFATGHLMLGGWVMWAGGFFDLVDGVVARHFDISTTFGGFLDSTIDRLVDMALLLGLIVHFSSSGENQLGYLASYVLVCSVLTSYMKARAELHLAHLPGGIMERGERMGLLIAGGIFGIMAPVLWLLAIGTTFTVSQRLWVAHREMTLLDSAGTPQSGEVA